MFTVGSLFSLLVSQKSSSDSFYELSSDSFSIPDSGMEKLAKTEGGRDSHAPKQLVMMVIDLTNQRLVSVGGEGVNEDGAVDGADDGAIAASGSDEDGGGVSRANCYVCCWCYSDQDTAPTRLYRCPLGMR